jgi:hypothetical protein
MLDQNLLCTKMGCVEVMSIASDGCKYSGEGTAREFVLAFESVHGHLKRRITRVNENSGNLSRAFKQLGSPAYPTVQQIDELRRRSELANPENISLKSRQDFASPLRPME